MINRVYKTQRVSPGLLRTRFQLGLLLVFIWVSAILLRLLYVQVFQHDYYMARANRQRQSVITLYPERGRILDRRNRDLAISVEMDSVYAIPDEMRNPKEALAEIGKIVPINTADILSTKSKTFVWIARKIDSDVAEKIKRLQLPGVYFTQESRRFYPNKELAAHVLGFVGVDNKGLSGVEYQYDGIIRGIPGKISALRDAKKRLLMTGQQSNDMTSTTGRMLQLTIDAAIQHIAEQELRSAIEEQNAEGGSVIIMNPTTGEILAMANEPTFNPNAYKSFNSSLWKNRSIQDYYEPGSTFKTVLAAAALDRGLVTPDQMFDCQMGSIILAGHVIHDHKPFGVLNFSQVMQKSSDVGMIKVGLMLGPDSLYQYSRSFGFGHKTGVDLPGEASGVLRNPKQWSAISIGAVSMGQEIGVTALQVLTMMSAIANNGYVPVPHCAAAISDSSAQMKPTVFGRPQPLPIQHSALQTLVTILQGVVEPGGTGTEAKIPGYTVAGKTGTAQRIGPSRTYADGGYIASFVGYAPVSRPAISMIAILYGPIRQYHGGEVAAPLFRKIGQQVLKYLDIPPDQIIENPALQAESVFPRATQATVFPDGVEPAAYTPPDQHHKLVNGSDDDKASELVMPYLYKRTASEAVQILTHLKAHFRLVGSGTVTNQWPAPGMQIRQDDLCVIMLSDSRESSQDTADFNGRPK
jgi:cell division protein FtsI (penicillin-binding protein 3)